MDEALDAFCLKDLVLTSALEDLCLEEICLDDHHVSLIIPAHRGEGRIFHDPPELPGEGQPEDGVVLFLVGHFWLWALSGQIVMEAWIWALGLVNLFLQSLP